MTDNNTTKTEAANKAAAKKTATKKTATKKGAAKKSATKKSAAKKVADKVPTPDSSASDAPSNTPPSGANNAGADTTGAVGSTTKSSSSGVVEPNASDIESSNETRARDGSGQFTPDDPSTQQNEAYDPPRPSSLSQAAMNFLQKTLASYFGAEGVTEEILDEAARGLELGKQTFIVEGKGNFRFALEVVDSDFCLENPSKDEMPEGMHVNLSRTLCDAKVYPS